VNDGVVEDAQAAFKRFLGRGKPAYVPTEWLSLHDAVAVIHQAGGQAVLAHPVKYKLTRTKLNELIRAFKDAGGAGMEVVSGMMMSSDILYIAGLCNRFELLASTGSDYHGDAMSRVGLGQQQLLPAGCTPIWEQWGIH
jgi:predicted metal-dependent phosphoesterase TrpH